MKRYRISIDGCDDSTVFEMDLTEQEAKLIERICEHSKKTSTYGCMPTVDVKEVEVSDVPAQ